MPDDAGLMAAPRGVGVLDGARALSAVIVLFHHIGTLDEDLWNSEYLDHMREEQWKGVPEESRREQEGLPVAEQVARGLMRGLAEAAEGDGEEKVNAAANLGAFQHLFGVGPGKIAVQTFIIIAGFVASYAVFVHVSEAQAKRGEAASPQQTGLALFVRYQKSLLKRFWRLALPLVPVQVLHYVLWHLRLAYGPWLMFTPREIVEKKYFSGVQAIWNGALSGSLWIMPVLFAAPFLALALQLPAMLLRPAARAMWYGLVWVYLSGNFVHDSSISQSNGVIIGVALADLYQHRARRGLLLGYRARKSNTVEVGGMPSDAPASKGLSARGRALRALELAFACVLVSVVWWPIDGIYGHRRSMILTASGFVYFALFAPRKLQLILDNPIMAWASRYSYQLYIWHLLVLSFFSATIRPLVSKPVLFVTGFSTCFAVAFLAYHAFEVPSNRVAEVITRWFVRDSIVAGSPRGASGDPAPSSTITAGGSGKPTTQESSSHASVVGPPPPSASQRGPDAV